MIRRGFITTEFVLTAIIFIVSLVLILRGYPWQIFLSSCIVSASYVISRGFVKLNKLAEGTRGMDVTVRKT